MKKLMTSVIILLPLLILAILLVSGAILSLVTHIYVESVEFVGNGALVLTMEDETAPPTKRLEVNVLPLRAENRGLIYAVENENIATVDENGVVTAKFYGETYVTVTSTENKAAFAKRAVVVTDVSVHKLVLNENRKSDLYEGETQELSVTVYPKEATNKSVIWSSSDESILHVEPNGTVTAVGAGDATVTAVSEDNPEVRVDTVIRCHKKLLDLDFDQTIVVTALKESKFPSVKMVPADADVTFAYKSDDPAVATVDGNGRITFHKEGHAVITVTATDFGGNTVEKQKEYTSTDGYFLPPLFAQKEFTVDYDEYKNGEPLPIPFADSLEDSYREFVRAKYTVDNVLEFDKDTKSFRFANPMPVGGKTIKAEITALVYSAEQAAPVEYEDYFFLTVLRNAEKISVSYLETADAAAITIAEKTLTLSANGGSEGAARVRVSPENHTDELSYSLVSGNDVAELSAAGVLSFRRAGETTVKILCSAEDTVTAEKTVRVIYAPAEAGEQKVIVSNGQTEDGTLVLTMASETDRQTGILYYTEPEGATVEYTAEADGGTVAEIKTENGARRIVPVCGGFATVKIAVTSENSAAQTYSVRVYVDCPVAADDLTVALGGKPCADKYGTSEKSVEYLFSVLENNASMAGKKLYVSYQGEKYEAEEGSPSHAGTIAFDAELSTLPVTFGVEYGEHAAELGATGTLPTVTRTLMRNAESLSFSYKGTPVRAITTTVTSLTFTAAADAAADKVNMAIAPANHTETVEYSLSAGQNDADITADGVLTFHDGSKACSVTVQVRLRGADGEISLAKEIAVNYAPRNEQDKVVVLPEGDMTDLLLRMDEAGKADKAKIDFIEPEGATVICRASGNVVKVEKIDYEWTILPLKGGFDTVTVTVSGQKEQTYTVNVYVDRTVKDNFTVKLNNTEYAAEAVFATTQTSIPFEVTVNCDEDAMAGKQLYVKYGDTIRATGAEGQNTFSDTIQFPKESGDLVVEFGVQYAETAAAYGPTGKLPAALRNFARNAESITFSYNGTEVTEVTTTSTSLTFTTDTVPAANRVNMDIAPASHTDTVEYSLKAGKDATIDRQSGELHFTDGARACEVTVQVDLRGADDKISLTKEILVKYSPRGARDKDVTLPAESGTHLLLFMSEASTDKGKINFTKPAGATVECTADNGVVEVTEQDNAWTIVPQKGGFDTVTVTVTGGNADATYTIHVYVNRAVTTNNFNVTLRDTTFAENVYGTASVSVPFEVAVSCEEGAMAGKQIYVRYGGEIKATGAEGQGSFSGSIDFSKESGDLPVEFGVQYAQKAEPYKPESTDGVALSSVTRTLARNAESITVTYGGVQTVKIVTKEATVNFGETAEAKITIAPAAHTDKLAYVYEDDTDIATFVGNKLTFRKAGTVTVKVQTVRGGTPTLTKQITVTHEPLGGNKEVTLNSESQNLVLPLDTADQKHALIYFTEKEGTEVSYTVEGSNGIVTLEQKNGDGRNTGVYHIIPQKGGLATVKVTVHGAEEKTYTVNVYVNAPVAAQDIGVTFQNAALSGSVYGTTQTAIPFEVTVTCDEGAMVGKQIYVKYGGEIKATGTAGQTTFSGSIDFPKESGALSVEFGVQYAADMEAYRLTGTIVSTSRSLERNAEQIAVTYGGVQTVKIVTPSDTLSFSEGQNDAAGAFVSVSPATHTDMLSYALEESESGTATLSKGKLTFSKPGTVTVKVLLERNGEVTLQKEVTVTYEPVGKNEKAEFENDRTESLHVLLPMDGEGKEGVIYFTEPEESTVQYEVTKGADTVVRMENRDGVWHIIPISGGFATVKITVSPIAAARAIERKEYIVETYVDLPVNAGDFAVTFNGAPCGNTFRTSLDSVNYSVTVTDGNGTTKGKKLYVSAGDVKNEANEGVLFLAGELALTRDSLPITFGVEYSEEAAAFGAKDGLASVVKTVSTSRGRLDDPPTVTYQDKTLQPGADNAVEFPNIGDEIAFTVKKAFSPADFDLTKNLPSIVTTEYVKASVSPDGETITLQALKPCTGQKMSLAIGGKTFFLSVTVHAKADQISVMCDGKPLDGSQKYDTLLRALTFHVTIGRTDGLAIDNKEIEYSLDGDIWQRADAMGNVTADITALTDGLLRFRSADRGANCEIGIEKVALEEFGLKFSVRNAEGADAVFGEVQTVLGAEELSFAIPTDMQGFVTVKVLPKRTDLLGGFGTTAEEFRSVISIDLNGTENWTAEYVASAGQIVIDHVDGEFRNTIKIQCGEKTVNVEFSRINLAWVEFIGFDSKNTANGGDVYKGYQQVRVFAKQSVYGGKDVDYFRMPVQALNKMAEEPTDADKVALSKLVWKFTSHNDATNATADVTVQSGKTVKYLGTEYKVADLGGGAYSLQTMDGVTVVGADGKYAASQPRVTWVDAFSEADKGYVRIYFGDYRGLSEVDVQNDYFGNFGEQKNWKKAEEHANNYDKSGRNFEASEGAFSYLRLEGGDGAASSKANAHFNFNVLEGSDLYNIFDAAGYYAHSNLVLHENLYGPGELDGNPESAEATAKGLILENTALGKTLIYGNGYQVNLEAKTASMGAASESDGITMSKAYNTVIKCANPNEVISKTHQKMVLKMAYAYYCELSYYYKFNPNGSAFYAKNTVFSNISKTAVQLYYNESMYAENCVFTECGTAIQVDNRDKLDPHIYIKGGFDALNYFNKTALDNLNSLIGLLYASVVNNVKDYLEWHGKTFTANAGSYADKNVDKIYVNILLFAYAPLNENVLVWDGDSYEKAVDTPLQNGSKILSKSLYQGYHAWTYETLDENGVRLDNATVEANMFGKATVTADMSQLFTEKRYIRLQCEYKAPGEKNYDHILWHRQEVYRDKSLIVGRKDHLDDLKESLKNTKWDDGSGVDGNGDPYEPAAQLTAMIAQTVVPRKNSYAG